MIVGEDIEDTPVALDEFDVGIRLRLQFGLQTGGAGQVVSAYAVLDPDPHSVHLSHAVTDLQS